MYKLEVVRCFCLNIHTSLLLIFFIISFELFTKFNILFQIRRFTQVWLPNPILIFLSLLGFQLKIVPSRTDVETVTHKFCWMETKMGKHKTSKVYVQNKNFPPLGKIFVIPKIDDLPMVIILLRCRPSNEFFHHFRFL